MVTSNIIQRTFNRLIPGWMLNARQWPNYNDYNNLFEAVARNIQARAAQGVQVLGEQVTQVTPWDAHRDITCGYMRNPNVYAVIRMIAKTAATVPLYSYIIQDEKAYKRLKALDIPKDEKSYYEFLREYKFLHTKAYELAGDQDDLQKLIDNPNPDIEKQEFYAGAYIYKLATGNFMIYFPVVPEGVNAGKVQGLYLMPVQNVTVMGTGVFPSRIVGYYMAIPGKHDFVPAEVIHSKYFNPDWDNSAGNIIGLSPLMALCGELEIDNKSEITELNQYLFGGPKVIVGFDDILPDEEGESQLGQVKKAWAQEKEGTKNSGKWALIAGKINVHTVGNSLIDLNVLPRKKLTKEIICSVYGINPIVLGSSEASTESNVKVAVKSLYTNAVLPEVYAMRDGLNKKITPLYNRQSKVKRVIDCDLSEISVLQPDTKLIADSFAAAPIYRPNDLLEALKFGRSDDPNMDKWYMKGGYTPIDDLNMELPPITNTEDYSNG